jgi:hypothetical protein
MKGTALERAPQRFFFSAIDRQGKEYNWKKIARSLKNVKKKLWTIVSSLLENSTKGGISGLTRFQTRGKGWNRDQWNSWREMGNMGTAQLLLLALIG